MKDKVINPDWLFEVSWEVCNKVGGIHTVISSKAATVGKLLRDKYICLGPDLPGKQDNPEFTEDPELFSDWRKWMIEQGFSLRVGRWNIPGRPVVFLVDFQDEFHTSDQLLGQIWYKFGVNSLGSAFDYVEPVVFANTCGKVIDYFCTYYTGESERIVAHFHEWMTGAGLLHLKDKRPNVATVFTTHATMLGRSLAGNGFPLYSRLHSINPDEWAEKLGIRAKFQMERAVAVNADVFTTVSKITAAECKAFFGKDPDIITPNAFDANIIPGSGDRAVRKSVARKKLLEIAREVTGNNLPDNAFLVLKSGRYEFQNKGVDVVLHAAARLLREKPRKPVVIFIAMPAGHGLPIEKERRGEEGIQQSHLTHWLTHPEGDPILKAIHRLGLNNREGQPVQVIFAPVYLDGDDGVFNMTYFELLPAFDLAVFPSYYEPWGYTPMEAIFAGVPAVTTILSGFGKWVCGHERIHVDHGVFILDRKDDNFDLMVSDTAGIIKRVDGDNAEQYEARVDSALKLSKSFTWNNFIKYYISAWDMGLEEVRSRRFAVTKSDKIAFRKISVKDHKDFTTPEWRKVFVQPQIPEALAGLNDLAFNLWTYWNRDARDIFRTIDEKLWEESKQNPVSILENVSYQHFLELADNPDFMAYYNEIYGRLKKYLEERKKEKGPKIAYFCMEYGLDPLLKLYSGGLGVLAGDYIKEASDSAVDMVAVGLLYRNGYFKQTLNEKGEQIALYYPQKFSVLPIEPVRDKAGEWQEIEIELPDRLIVARIWKVNVGAVPLYLLDTDLSKNTPEDRRITSELYGGDWDNRLRQEILLGIGGVKMLRKLRIETELFHLNEGHAAFAGIERLHEYVLTGMSFEQALEVIRPSSLFTTHTPVPAGHDVFSETMMLKYFDNFAEKLGISWKRFMELGKSPGNVAHEPFSMSFLAARMSQEINGVSKLHGQVSRDIFRVLYPGYFSEEIPVGYVTNGAHYATHTAIEMNLRLRKNFQNEFFHHELDPEKWKIKGITNQQIWSIRKRLKAKLIVFLKDYLEKNLTQAHQSPKYVMSVIQNLKPNALIIGFARRFATYKRAALIFYDIKRLARLMNDPERPVILLFSGKAHPKDIPGQELIKKVVEISRMPEFLGKVIFLEDYNMYIAKYLVSGCDVWLNNPTRPLEASGTSGIKASFNGVLNLSVLDGWWDEGYVKGTGWALPRNRVYEYQEFQDELDAEMIYSLMEKELLPQFFTRDDQGLPQAWLRRIRATIRKIVPRFTMHRMLNDYYERFYNPMYGRYKEFINSDYAGAKELSRWKEHVQAHWNRVEVREIKVFDSTKHALRTDGKFSAGVKLFLAGLSPDEVGVELVFTRKNPEKDERWIMLVQNLDKVETIGDEAVYTGSVKLDVAGVYDYGIRMYPKNKLLKYRQDLPLVRWI